MEKQIIAVDLDGTLCESYDWHDWIERAPVYWVDKMKGLKPIQKTIDYCNKLYDEGHEIYIFTARDDVYTPVTIDWLKRNGVKYHWIQMKKPFYHLLIDDRSCRPEEIE